MYNNEVKWQDFDGYTITIEGHSMKHILSAYDILDTFTDWEKKKCSWFKQKYKNSRSSYPFQLLDELALQILEVDCPGLLNNIS